MSRWLHATSDVNIGIKGCTLCRIDRIRMHADPRLRFAAPLRTPAQRRDSLHRRSSPRARGAARRKNRRSHTRNAWHATRRWPYFARHPKTLSSAPIRSWLSMSICWRSQPMQTTPLACCVCFQAATIRSSPASASRILGIRADRNRGDAGIVRAALRRGDRRLRSHRRANGQGRRVWHPRHRVALGEADRGLLLQCRGIAGTAGLPVAAGGRSSHRRQTALSSELLLLFRRRSGRRGRVGGSAGRASGGVGRVGLAVGVVSTHRRLEIADAFAQSLAKFAQFLRAKDQQDR